MSVSVTVALPTQPAAGSSVYQPLGGNGYTAPNSYYSVLTQLAGDASGGTNTITVTLDPRFECIVSLVQSFQTGGAAAVEHETQLLQQLPTAAPHRARASGTGQFEGALSDTSVFSWSPPLIIDPLSVIARTENVDGDTHNALIWIYNFNKRASEVTPLNILLAALPSIEGQNVP